MAVTHETSIANATRARAIHPLHGVLLGGMVPLYLGGLLSDWAYSSTFEIQWSNFAAWLIAGAMVYTGFTLAWALVEWLRARRPVGRGLLYLVLLAVIFVLGLINSFVHARDAWATMPQGLTLSLLVTVLAVIATWLGFSTLRRGDAQ